MDGVNHFLQHRMHDAVRGPRRTMRVMELLKHIQCIRQRPTFPSVWHTLLPPCSVHIHTHNIKINWEASHTHARTSAHAHAFLFSLNSDLLGSDLWHLHTSDLEGGGRHTQSRAQTRSNTELTDGERADSKRSTMRCSRASATAAVERGSVGVGGRAARAFTLGEAWRACSLRRTSRRCCHTPCPSGELLEPCSHGCPWGKHTSALWEIQIDYQLNGHRVTEKVQPRTP